MQGTLAGAPEWRLVPAIEPGVGIAAIAMPFEIEHPWSAIQPFCSLIPLCRVLRLDSSDGRLLLYRNPYLYISHSGLRIEIFSITLQKTYRVGQFFSRS